jgi:hypothetical protein
MTHNHSAQEPPSVPVSYGSTTTEYATMDCVIPGHSVRPFCASIGCLSRIGKDLYVAFDAIEGLALRSLNDAKSAYAYFRFEPAFFERCTAPPPTVTPSRKRDRNKVPEPSQEPGFSCRASLRSLAAVVRPRKNVASLRIRSETSSSALYLSFEFHLQKNQDAIMRVVHRVKVADANGVSAVATRDGCSEIVAFPKVLLRLLEPLKKTAEASMIIKADAQMVMMSSFHHTDTLSGGQAATNNNAILQATSASLLKSETGIGCDEFEELYFREDRDLDEEGMPQSVNREVNLVFPIKEAKALLQFCSQSHLDQELRVSLSFHWGGRPLMLESKTESFSAELVLATVDHKSLKPRSEEGELEA